jgi:tryptophanyl-tRNA synthetase
MSKSYKNTIPLFGTRDEIEKAVLSIVTDSSGDRPENVYAIHTLFKTEEQLAPLYEENKGKYKALKDALITDIDAYVAPMRERRESISDHEVLRVLSEGSEKARAVSGETMKRVRDVIGISF